MHCDESCALNKPSDVVFIQIQFKGKKAFVSASI